MSFTDFSLQNTTNLCDYYNSMTLERESCTKPGKNQGDSLKMTGIQIFDLLIRC